MYLKIFHSKKDPKMYELLCDELNNLIEEKQVYCTNSKKGLYILNPFKEGTCFIKKNKDMYVECGDETFKVTKNTDGSIVKVTKSNSLILTFTV